MLGDDLSTELCTMHINQSSSAFAKCQCLVASKNNKTRALDSSNVRIPRLLLCLDSEQSKQAFEHLPPTVPQKRCALLRTARQLLIDGDRRWTGKRQKREREREKEGETEEQDSVRNDLNDYRFNHL